MKKIINGRSYNTDTAKKLAHYYSDYAVNDFKRYEEELYRKKNGEYFLYGHGWGASPYAKYVPSAGYTEGEKIIPISYEYAKEWSEENLETEKYEEIWGEVSEDDEDIYLYVKLTPENNKNLNTYLSKNLNLSKTDLINEILEKYFL